MTQHPPWILFHSMIANIFYNMDSQRFQKATLETRSEGWTETWGGKEQQLQEEQAGATTERSSSTTKRTSSQHLVFEDTTNSMWVEVDDPSISIVLTQYRPAWLEQMVLKFANIKYIVVNSTYHCHEATGPLPYLRDESASKTVLVGRHHPTNLVDVDVDTNGDSETPSNGSSSCSIHDNSIVAYLQQYRNVDLDAHLTEPRKGQAHAYLQIIQTELQPLILFLRYEDQDAWEQVYRKQYIRASCPKQKGDGSSNADITWMLQLRGRFQAMMERSVERRRLLEISRRTATVEQAIGRARKAYQALERQLVTIQSNEKKVYLLGTDRPALVDAALWAHLAEALGDIHLVVVLASFPNLMQYFQDMYHQYFGTKRRKPKASICWEAWNERQNLGNAFQQIPILSKNQMAKHGAFKDAIDLMQNLSLQKQELNEVLAAVKAKRDEEPWPKPRKASESLLYRWAMGEDIDKSAQTSEKDENPLRKKLLRDQVRNDQKWISGVACVSVVAILLLQAGASASE
jgi:Outer mitochondrial membrane transport complex protein/Glutathione S-transferase, C-terminal domain